MEGLQFELNFDPAKTKLIAAIPMMLSIQNNNIAWDKTDDGLVRLSWNDNQSQNISEGDVLVEFLFKGDQADLQMDYFEIDLIPEAYQNLEGELLVRPIQFRNIESASFDFEVYQNVPNPFKDETIIEFMLDRSGEVQFTVTDQTGRLLLKEVHRMDAGLNRIELNSQSIDATGLLYYQISTGTHTATKKMILIQ